MAGHEAEEQHAEVVEGAAEGPADRGPGDAEDAVGERVAGEGREGEGRQEGRASPVERVRSNLPARRARRGRAVLAYSVPASAR